MLRVVVLGPRQLQTISSSIGTLGTLWGKAFGRPEGKGKSQRWDWLWRQQRGVCIDGRCQHGLCVFPRLERCYVQPTCCLKCTMGSIVALNVLPPSMHWPIYF